MQKNKSLLEALFKATTIKEKKSILTDCSLEQVDLIFYILFSITQGEIPIKKNNYEILKKSKKLSFLYRLFENKSKFEKNLTLSLKEKRLILLKLARVYHCLLYPIFHR